MLEYLNNKIIVFEGLDNCFKETATTTFVKQLQKLAYDEIESPRTGSIYRKPCKIFTESFPRYGNQMCLPVERWLDGSFDRNHLKLHPEAIVSLYSIDRYSYWFESIHGAERNIDKLYSEDYDKVFVFDRYSISNAIYNPIVGVDTTVDDLEFDHSVFGIPQADIVVWMRNSNYAIFKDLIAQKQNKDANELDDDFIKTIWERSERAIQSNIFKRAGIKLVVVDIIENDGIGIKSRDILAKEVFNKIFGAIEETEEDD